MTTPDAVARAVRALAAEGRRAWPVRGDSSVVPEGCEPIDYSGLTAVRRVDVRSAVVWVEAGATWAEVEAVLAPRALTLGPLPLWVRHRTIFQSLAEDDRLRPSPRFGQLSDGLLALRAALPSGVLSRAPTTPRRATGPDLPRCVLGARHRAGLVTDVHLQAWPRPLAPVQKIMAFADFAEALTRAVAVLRAGVRPTHWRLARGRGDLRLSVGLVSAAEAAICVQAAGGREVESDLSAEPRELKAVFLGGRTEAAARAEALSGSCITDIRPEGATVYAARGVAVALPEWPTLAEAVFRHLEKR